MGDLSARLDDEASVTVPPKFRQHAEWDDEGGQGATGPVREIVSDHSQLLRLAGLDPDAWRIVGRVSQWTKTHHGKADTYSFFFQFERAGGEEFDLPALYATARRARTPRFRPEASTDRSTVVVFADPQIGKTGSRGGTPELIDRLAQKRAALEPVLKARKPSTILLADAGDGFEGFESGGNPMFTNDLSLTQQMDAYGTELWLFIEQLHRFAPVTVASVPSNHTAWRRAKQQLGKPSDDLGLYVHNQVRKITDAANMNVTYRQPAAYDEAVSVDLHGTIIGLVHGNQFGPNQAISWWEKQTFGAQAIAHADVLISGHYHSFGAGVAGRNPHSGRQRWWLGAPTLDNGSDWYRTTSGRDSDPGMLIFDVTPDGFDLASLVIL